MRSDVHEPDNPTFVNHKGCGASDVVRVNPKSMVHAVTPDDAAVFVRQQWKLDTMAIGILSYLPGPLTNHADDYGLECRIFLQMCLQTRQLAAAIGSPRSSEEYQHDVFFTSKRFKIDTFLMNGAQRKWRRGIPNPEHFVFSRHNLSTGNLRRPRWLGKALA